MMDRLELFRITVAAFLETYDEISRGRNLRTVFERQYIARRGSNTWREYAVLVDMMKSSDVDTVILQDREIVRVADTLEVNDF